MDDDPEVIRSQMDQTRADMAEKLESLESRVSETVQSAGDAVSDTISSVQQVVRSVSETLDIRRHVQRHPWIAFTSSVAAGYLLSRHSASPGPSSTRRQPLPSQLDPVSSEPRSQSSSGRASGPTLLGSLMGVIQNLGAQGLPLAIDYLFQTRRPADSPPNVFPDSLPATAWPPPAPAATERSRPISRQMF